MFSQVIYDSKGVRKTARVISDKKLAHLLAQVYFLKDAGEDIELSHHFDADTRIIGYRVCRANGNVTVFTDLKEAIDVEDIDNGMWHRAEGLWG